MDNGQPTMPIYEYQCQACHHQLEALQKMSDDPLVDCPECGAAALRKKVSAAAFRLKGGGWYETDFKSSGQKNLAGDGKPAEAKPADSKSDSKPDSASNSSKDSGKNTSATG